MGHSSRQQQAENNDIKKSTFMEKPPPPWLMLKTYPSHPWALDTEPFATHPWIGQWLGCMLVLALMLSPQHFNQPCWDALLQANLAITFFQSPLPLLLWTLNHPLAEMWQGMKLSVNLCKIASMFFSNTSRYKYQLMTLTTF